MITGFPAAVRRLSQQDLGACLDLAADRGWQPDDGEWRFLLGVCDGFGIDDPSGGLAGTVAVARYEPGLAMIGQLLVASRHGRRGLGTLLMRHALAHAAGRTVYLYATPVGRPLYERLGFRATGTIAKHVGEYRAGPAASATHVRAPVPADRAGVLRLDREAFGADRSAVLAALAGFAERVFVADNHDGLAGHAAVWRRHHGVLSIGPVVARGDHTAQALIEALAARAEGPVRVDLLGHNPGLSRWVTERGLMAATAPNAVMVYRGRSLPGLRSQLYAPVMQGLG